MGWIIVNFTKRLTLAFSLYACLTIPAFSGQCERGNPSKSLNCTSYRQTTNYTCGPAAVMSILRYYGKLSAKEMNRTTEMRIAKEMAAGPGGTTPAQVMDWLSNHGFSISSGQCVTSKILKGNINRGIPTIVAYNNHWLISKGYKGGGTSTYKNEDEYVFADSACGTSTLPTEVIDMMWSTAAMKNPRCGIHAGYYIVATPNR